MPQVSDKDLQNIHKLVYLANEFPKHTMRQVGELFAVSMLEINTTIWRAKDLGYLTVDRETGAFTVDKKPSKWDFGPEVEDLMDTILYAFSKIAEESQADMEENNFTKWAVGYPSQDVIIAMKKLLADKKLVSYELVNVTEVKPSKKGAKRGKPVKNIEDAYTFYSLPENAEHQWGKKQFVDATKLK